MRADTFAKLVVLETLVDAEVGVYLEHAFPSLELFREGMVARVSDLVDEIDALDAVAAARIYDAIVDFLAELPQEDEGVLLATMRFKRAIDRIVKRGMDPRELEQTSTWAVVADELLEELALEYHRAIPPEGDVQYRNYRRVETLLARTREAADRMLWTASLEGRADFRSEADRLTFAVRHQRLPAASVDLLVRGLQRRVRAHRPSNLTRIGAYVVGQLLRRATPGADRREAVRRKRRDSGGEEPQGAG